MVNHTSWPGHCDWEAGHKLSTVHCVFADCTSGQKIPHSARAQRVVGPIRLGFSGRSGTNRCKHCPSTTEMITNTVFRRDIEQADLDWGLEQAYMFSHTYRPKHSLMEIHTSVEGACLSCDDSTIDELGSVLTRQFT